MNKKDEGDFVDTSIFEGIIQWSAGSSQYRAEDRGSGIFNVSQEGDDSWRQIAVVRLEDQDENYTPRQIYDALLELEDNDIH